MSQATIPINQQRIVSLTHAAIQSLNALLREIGQGQPDQPTASLNAAEEYEAYIRGALGFDREEPKPKTPAQWTPPPRLQHQGPECPKCHRPMKLRHGFRGEFWGCQSYPHCNGTRQPKAGQQ